jgi:hypothetical protein
MSKKSKVEYITCHTCGKVCGKRKNEIDRQKRNGRTEFYCNRSCHGKVGHKHLEYWTKHHQRYLLQGFDQSDEYTPYRYYIKNVNQRVKENPKYGKTDIDLEYLKQLYEEQNGKCPMTGIGMKLRTNKRKELTGPETASLDRIDNSKGYVKGNVRFVTYMYNIARNKFSDEDVIDFCRAVASYNYI